MSVYPVYSYKGQEIVHFSKDTKLFPFILLCGICLATTGKSRYFYSSRQKFYHLHLKHTKLENDFQNSESKPRKIHDDGFYEELKTLEQLSILNQKGVFIK